MAQPKHIRYFEENPLEIPIHLERLRNFDLAFVKAIFSKICLFIPIFGNFDENQTSRKQIYVLHHFKAFELESSKYNLFHEINTSKIHNNLLKCEI